MSFEGYYQYICEGGHYTAPDVYDTAGDARDDRCALCDSAIVWWNLVDLTNGSHDEDGNRIDGFIEIEMLGDPSTHECPMCHQLVIPDIRFRVPVTGGHHV